MEARGLIGMLALLAATLSTALLAPRPGASTPATPPPAASPAPLPADRPATSAASHRQVRPPVLPGAERLRAARRYAGARRGSVALAVVDSRGRLRGWHRHRPFIAASLAKAMVLAAELRRLADAGAPLDAATAALLGAMIRSSDNEAADALYGRVGDAGLLAVADRAGMDDFTIAGHWGNARVAAADMARLFADVDRVLPSRHREYGRSLLGSIVPEQSWGIPAAAGARWGVRFKGGWLPDRALVNQAAELRERDGPRQISIAILTDRQPSHEYGVATVEGVAARLLGRAGGT